MINFSLKNILYLLYEYDKDLVLDHIIYAHVEKKNNKNKNF